TSVNETTITKTDAGWTDNQYQGLVVVPNISKRDYNYKIISNTGDTLTVEGPMDLTKISAGNTFAIVYGKLIKDSIDLSKITITPPETGTKATRFFNSTGEKSFADGDATYDGVCEVCHTQTTHFRNNGGGSDQLHSNMGSPAGTRCTSCHQHINGFRGMGGGAHSTHVLEGYGPQLACTDCHGANVPPLLADGQNLANTTVCNNCHSASGAAIAKQYWSTKGSSLRTEGSWAVTEGEASYCGSCHDETAGNTMPDGSGDIARNIMGDNSTYGFYITGHGKQSGNYARLSYQDTAATGNPAANRQRCGQCHGIPPVEDHWPNPPFPPTPSVTPCSFCHDLTSTHFNNSGKRLRAGFENDQDNTNCKQCHSYDASEGTAATSEPHFYTSSVGYENSAHKGKLCTDCHDVHGASGPYTGMTKGNKQGLCYQCHSAPGGVVNKALSNRSGYVSATNIQDAFGKSVKHPLGKLFSLDGNVTTYTLECTSCHNVHVVTGKYWEADQNKSPVTRFTNNLTVWGASSGEKINDYAGSGLYRTPFNDVFTGAQLPDYASFCLDCHAGSLTSPSNPNPTQPTYGLINWNGDPHGRLSADAPHGSHLGHALQGGDSHPCPNWSTCGLAYGWDGDDCVGDQSTCWPVRSRSLGDVLFQREPFSHSDRIKGRNFVLACIDCHEAHGSNRGSFVRERLNTTDTGGCGNGSNGNNCVDAGNWNSNCNICHYYYSPQHDGMGCGSASCHAGNHTNGTWWNSTNSPHGIEKGGSSGGARSLTANDSGLVIWYSFENNLQDSADWRLHGKWKDGVTGSYAAGKSGQAVVLDDAHTIQAATQDATWSTCDGGDCGTGHPPNWGGGGWKYTHMKYNTTLEAWVYPTDSSGSEYIIFSKHTWYNNGDYLFALRKIGSTLRVVFVCLIDNNGGAQDGRAGTRGAYGSVGIPLNKWTHVAAAFDTSGPDRNPSDPSVGRIRIYVNGEDVTTSGSSGEYIQPGAGETSIFAYPENSGWNNSICDLGGGIYWCTGEFSIGGFHEWQNGFKGKLDDAKVWNVTKDAAYFSSYDPQTAPYIGAVEGLIGNNRLTVYFSEGVYGSGGSALDASDLALTDANGDNPRTITGVTHTAGASTAVITMSSPLVAADVNADTAAAVGSSVFDDYNNAAGTETVTISLSPQCPTSPVSIQLNDPSGSTYVMDTQNILYGAVTGSGTLTGVEYSGGGEGSGRYIDFEYNDTCLQASTAMTLETRIKPSGLDTVTGSTDYIRRILDRTGGGNYQLSVWRDMANTYFPDFTPPDYVASIALWVNVVDAHGGNNFKPVLTNYTTCPIQNDHWYQIKAVWNTNKPGGAPDQFFVPAGIYVDDQGTDGNGAGESWPGYVDCTDSSQSYNADSRKLYTGDSILIGNGDFVIGANAANHANNLFNGLIDWITWKDSVY
ncbi:MAG: hypothetical protein HZA14_03765, partial [Nitrospirae bacterium]|nr:hypothetical protein [Nitrospirota bacterium]